jgi:TolA-binding protein
VTQALVKKYAKSPKVPDAMLLQASAYLSEGEIAKAKSTLQSIVKRFPKSEQANTAKERLNAIKKLG